MATRAEKIAAKKLDNEINAIYNEVGAGAVIDIFDIPKIFATGRKARAEGLDMKEAIVNFLSNARKN